MNSLFSTADAITSLGWAPALGEASHSLIKDVALLGASLLTGGEAVHAWQFDVGHRLA